MNIEARIGRYDPGNQPTDYCGDKQNNRLGLVVANPISF
jgi:hypothetical protein